MFAFTMVLNDPFTDEMYVGNAIVLQKMDFRGRNTTWADFF